MTRPTFVGLLPVAVITIMIFGPTASLRLSAEHDAERRFLQSVGKYITLRQQVERLFPPIDISADIDTVHRATDARLAAIRHARAAAQAGDIFHARVADLFRARIRQSFTARGHDASELIDEMNDGHSRWLPAVVNGRFCWEAAAATPAHVIAVLPDLPAELQYRFVGPDLVLVDISASIIVDILPDVLDLSPQGDAQ
jgi:hypothetical protein